VWDLTLQFSHFEDMLSIMKLVKNRDVNRNGHVNELRGKVMVVLGDSVMSAYEQMIDQKGVK
jgi:hypothetical protein